MSVGANVLNTEVQYRCGVCVGLLLMERIRHIRLHTCGVGGREAPIKPLQTQHANMHNSRAHCPVCLGRTCVIKLHGHHTSGPNGGGLFRNHDTHTLYKQERCIIPTAPPLRIQRTRGSRTATCLFPCIHTYVSVVYLMHSQYTHHCTLVTIPYHIL